jgi:hypothetical protein
LTARVKIEVGLLFSTEAGSITESLQFKMMAKPLWESMNFVSPFRKVCPLGETDSNSPGRVFFYPFCPGGTEGNSNTCFSSPSIGRKADAGLNYFILR